jgi:hypothetical protein
MSKYLSGIEMFEQLADKENKERYIDFIKIDDLREFVKDCLEYVKWDYEIGDYENKVAEILVDGLIKKELLATDNHQAYVDTLLAAAFLHNIYFDEERIPTSLMKAREEFDHIAEVHTLPPQIREMIWDSIEGQLGDLTPMSKTKPSPNTPQDLLANCIWIVRNSKRWFY